MTHRKCVWRILAAAAAGLLVISALAALNLYADVQRIGCQSSGQMLGPASPDGYVVSGTTEAGACFVSFASVEERDIRISRVAYAEDRSFAACQSLQQQLSSGWSDFFGTRCTSIAFVRRADGDCTQTDQGCQERDWPVEELR